MLRFFVFLSCGRGRGHGRARARVYARARARVRARVLSASACARVHAQSPVGGEAASRVIRLVGQKTRFPDNFVPKDHIEIGRPYTYASR